ncbi:hypothetical protein [Sulfuricurvum sp.]|uniref:hypothetical protein n=1 Tax=Sulfuricurvum sp. TaxID=2025608 RepID=UPI003BAFCE6E
MKIELTNQTGGVKAFLSGFKTDDVSAKIEACRNGACECDCDPALMQKIAKIELSTAEGGTTITIEGDVDAETLAPMMQECLIGDHK